VPVPHEAGGLVGLLKVLQHKLQKKEGPVDVVISRALGAEEKEVYRNEVEELVESCRNLARSEPEGFCRVDRTKQAEGTVVVQLIPEYQGPEPYEMDWRMPTRKKDRETILELSLRWLKKDRPVSIFVHRTVNGTPDIDVASWKLELGKLVQMVRKISKRGMLSSSEAKYFKIDNEQLCLVLMPKASVELPSKEMVEDSVAQFNEEENDGDSFVEKLLHFWDD